MEKEITVKDFSSVLFWDIDKENFDLDKNSKQFIQRVLEYGNWNDWLLIKQYYGMDAIKNSALAARSLDAVTLAFVSNLFEIDKKEFRCYRHRQSHPNLWNS